MLESEKRGWRAKVPRGCSTPKNDRGRETARYCTYSQQAIASRVDITLSHTGWIPVCRLRGEAAPSRCKSSAWYSFLPKWSSGAFSWQHRSSAICLLV